MAGFSLGCRYTKFCIDSSVISMNKARTARKGERKTKEEKEERIKGITELFKRRALIPS